MVNPLVSIIVPVYNVSIYLEKCIDSILNQIYQNIEVILVDDGSKDKSGLICDTYRERFKNVKVIHKVNAGLGMARNSGLEIATGEYVTFVDGDDFIAVDHISQLVNGILNKNADVCYCGYMKQIGESFKEQKNPLSGYTLNKNEIFNFFIPRMCGKLDYRKVDEVQMSVCMALYQRNIISKENISFHSERELISEDFIFNLDYLQFANTITMINSCTYYYRDNANSLTKVYIPNRLDKQIFFTKYVIERIKKLGLYDECIQRIYSTFFQWVRNIVKREARFYKQIGFFNSLRNIKSVCHNEFVIKGLEIYDDSNLTKNAALLNKLIRKKKCFLIWIVSYIKDITKK